MHLKRTWFYFGVRGGYGKWVKFNIMNLNRQGRLFEMGMLPVFKTVPGHEKWSRIYSRPTWQVYYVHSKFNQKMKLQNKNVLLLVDNASSHKTELIFSNLKIHFLPPNTTSVLQPCDAGIIRSFKCFYKNKLVEQMIVNIERKKELFIPDLKEAIFMSRDSWLCVTKETIHNCWVHVNILGEKINSVHTTSKNDDELCHQLFTNITKFNKASINLDQFAFKAKDYLELDSEIQTGEILTSEDIVELVETASNKDDELESLDSNNIEPQKVLKIDAVHSVDLLISYFKNNNLDYDQLVEIKKTIENTSYNKLIQKKLIF